MKFRFLLLAILFSTSLFAQDEDRQYYTIQLGAFTGPKKEQFKNLSNVGHIYDIPANTSLTRVYLGGYNNRTAADNALALVKAKGYQDAFVKTIFLHADDKIYTVQLASFNYTDQIDWRIWENFGELYMRIENGKLKLSSGLFNEQISADDALFEIRQKGYQDAFTNHVHFKILHQMTDFEKGFNSMEVKKASNRLSVSVLQDLLRRKKYYSGPADGVITERTLEAMSMYKELDYRYQAYKQVRNQSALQSHTSDLQEAINFIPDDPRKAERYLKAFDNLPMAKAYRAYLYQSGKVSVENKSIIVNDLMNGALKIAFQNFNKPNRIDLTKRYNYQNLELLILHLRIMAEASTAGDQIPCWLFEEHPSETKKAFAPYWNSSRDDYQKSNDCDGFMKLEEIQILLRISRDFDLKEESEKLSDRYNLAQRAKNRRTEFYVNPQALNNAEALKYQKWYKSFWANLHAWENKEILHAKMAAVFGYAFHDALYVLENHFIEKSFTSDQATSLALAVLYETLEYHMNSYF